MNTTSSAPKRGPKPNPKTRENLVRAGVSLLHSNGYAATGVQAIVETAQVPKGSFYNHFESKEALGKEAVDLYFGNALPELQRFFEDQSLPPVTRLKTYFERRIQSFDEIGFARGCLLGNMSLEVADHSEIIRQSLASHFDEWGFLFEQCIAEAQESGAVSNTLPASILARFLLNAWEGALLRMRVEKNERALKEFIQVSFDTVLV